MFEAQLVIAKSSAYEIFSPWFPRGGDRVIITAEAVEIGDADVEVRLYTKSAEDEGSGSDVTSGTNFTIGGSVGRTSGTWGAELKDMVRYRFEVTGTQAGDWLLFRMLPPVWFDEVVA